MKKHKIFLAGILRLDEWRVVPWYESWTCSKGCCTAWRFTWLFFRCERYITTD
jgi:hypothetical protein